MSQLRLYQRSVAPPPERFLQRSAFCPQCRTSYTLMQLCDNGYFCPNGNCRTNGMTTELIPRRREFTTLAGQQFWWEQVPTGQTSADLVGAALEELDNEASTQEHQSSAGASGGYSTHTSSRRGYYPSPSTIYAPSSSIHQTPTASTSYHPQGSMTSSVQGGAGYGPQPNFRAQYSSSETQPQYQDPSQYQYDPQYQDSSQYQDPSQYQYDPQYQDPSQYQYEPQTQDQPSSMLDPPPGESKKDEAEARKCKRCLRHKIKCDRAEKKLRCGACNKARAECIPQGSVRSYVSPTDSASSHPEQDSLSSTMYNPQPTSTSSNYQYQFVPSTFQPSNTSIYYPSTVPTSSNAGDTITSESQGASASEQPSYQASSSYQVQPEPAQGSHHQSPAVLAVPQTTKCRFCYTQGHECEFKLTERSCTSCGKFGRECGPCLPGDQPFVSPNYVKANRPGPVYQKPYSGPKKGTKSSKQPDEEKCHVCWKSNRHCDQRPPVCTSCENNRKTCRTRDPNSPPPSKRTRR
jgi:hypothetical protein